EELTAFCQIINITGPNKQVNQSLLDNYQSYEFLEHDKLLALMSRADLVISRAGLGVLTELSNLAKPTILIPLPDSHQEDNAALWLSQEAAAVLKNGDLTPDKLVETVKEILSNEALRNHLSQNIKAILPAGATEALKLIIISLVENSPRNNSPRN
ncbi:MAG: glycosyltransferase, partial [Candidatus Falkowbacteria bacterium]|nr:glycosyltransferase [Candidatus Falkowbacteria bacterium]